MQRKTSEEDRTAAEAVDQEVAMMRIGADGRCGAAIQGGGGYGGWGKRQQRSGPVERCCFSLNIINISNKNQKYHGEKLHLIVGSATCSFTR